MWNRKRLTYRNFWEKIQVVKLNWHYKNNQKTPHYRKNSNFLRFFGKSNKLHFPVFDKSFKIQVFTKLSDTLDFLLGAQKISDFLSIFFSVKFLWAYFHASNRKILLGIGICFWDDLWKMEFFFQKNRFCSFCTQNTANSQKSTKKLKSLYRALEWSYGAKNIWNWKSWKNRIFLHWQLCSYDL